MDCLVLPVLLLRRRNSTASRLGYQRLQEDDHHDDRKVTVVVGKDKSEFLVDPFVLEESPFQVLIDVMKERHGSKVIMDATGEKKRVILMDLDAILFEHMLWLMNNDCCLLFQLNFKEIVDFYAQD